MAKVLRIDTVNKLNTLELEGLKYSTIIDVNTKGDICILTIEDTEGNLSEIQLRPQG